MKSWFYRITFVACLSVCCAAFFVVGTRSAGSNRESTASVPVGAMEMTPSESESITYQEWLSVFSQSVLSDTDLFGDAEDNGNIPIRLNVQSPPEFDGRRASDHVVSITTAMGDQMVAWRPWIMHDYPAFRATGEGWVNYNHSDLVRAETMKAAKPVLPSDREENPHVLYVDIYHYVLSQEIESDFASIAGADKHEKLIARIPVIRNP